MSLNTVVERNNRSLKLGTSTFGKRSPHKGKTFHTPELRQPSALEVTTDNASSLVGSTVLTGVDDYIWFGLEDINLALNREARAIFGDLHTSNIDEKTGILNETALMEEWKEFTSGVEKITDIEDQMDSLREEQGNIVDNPNFGADTEEGNNLLKRVREINTKVAELKEKHAGIKEIYKVRAANRKPRTKKGEANTEATPTAEVAAA